MGYILRFAVKFGVTEVLLRTFVVNTMMLPGATSKVSSVVWHGVLCDMDRINTKGRTFIKGQALSSDFRRSIVDEIVRNGGDIVSGYFPGRFSDIANSFKVSRETVKNIWNRLHNDGTIEPRKKTGGGIPSSLTQGDLELVEVLKNERPTCSLKEIHEKLEEFGDIPQGTSYSAISRALKERMLSGKQYSRKKVSTIAEERFTVNNVAYTQMFIDYLHSKDPFKLKFFDQCGLKTPSHGKRVYGHSPVGERCVELQRYHQSPNITVNLLAGLNGVEYINTIHGPSDTLVFLDFFGQAGKAANIETGRPAPEVGDIVVMDNCPTHHYAGGDALREWLGERNIELVYTPTYSPDFNPVEFVFNKMRTVMNFNLQEFFAYNIELAAIEASTYIKSEDMLNFFRYTNYLDI